MIPRSDWRLRPPFDLTRLIQLRRMMLVHSLLYYQLDESLITDHQWQALADELTQLQSRFGWRHHFYDEYFQEWNGSTGFHLPRDPDVERVALRLVAYARQNKPQERIS